MRTTELMTALATNRRNFFALIEAIERELHISIDVQTLEGLLDSYYDKRQVLSNQEAQELLMAVAHPVPPVTVGGQKRRD